MKSTMRELNAITHEECNTTQTIRGLRTKVEINEKIFKARVISKATSNFIFQFLMNKQRFKTIKLKKTHYLLIINENKLKNK